MIMKTADEVKHPPKVFSEFKQWLQDHYNSLPKRLQNVAVFVTENPALVAMSTVAIISEKANVNPSTLVRFAKAIGYEGFSDMQAVFQESMHHLSQPYAQRIKQLGEGQHTERSVLHRFTDAASSSINRLHLEANQAAISQISKQLAGARTIYIAGRGRATPVTTYLHYTFVKLGIQAVLLDGIASTVNDKARLIRRDEALIAVSFNPYTANTHEIVDICRERKVPVAAITDSVLSPIAQPDNMSIEIVEEEVGGIRGLSTTMCIALCVAVETGKCRSQQ